jgi:outer membrane receptor protein involved in Fe transport
MLPGIAVRGSYSTGFLPPSINDLVPVVTLIPPNPFSTLTDPRRGNSFVTNAYTQIAGGNPDLDPERSRAFSAGLLISSPLPSGLRFSADYTRIEKDGEIGSPPFDLGTLENLFPQRVVRGSRLSTDPPDWAGPIQSIDFSSVNVAKTTVEAADFQVDGSFRLAGGPSIQVYAVATRQISLKHQLLPGSATFDTVGYRDGPLKWRGNAGINITSGRVLFTWNMQYYSGYSVRFGSLIGNDLFGSNDLEVKRQGSSAIPSQMYHDIGVRYVFPSTLASALRGVSVSASILNIFDKKPPVIATLDVLGTYSPYGDPRLRRFSLALTKHF